MDKIHYNYESNDGHCAINNAIHTVWLTFMNDLIIQIVIIIFGDQI